MISIQRKVQLACVVVLGAVGMLAQPREAEARESSRSCTMVCASTCPNDLLTFCADNFCQTDFAACEWGSCDSFHFYVNCRAI
jgi:hypothetical protein